MITMKKPLLALTVKDIMSTPVTVIQDKMPLRAAAQLLQEMQISGAPVVNAEGKCVGVISAMDFVRWADKSNPEPKNATSQIRTCAFVKEVTRRDGKKVALCTLQDMNCSLQVPGKGVNDEPAMLCLLPHSIMTDWQQIFEDIPAEDVENFMTRDVVTTGTTTKLCTVARTMIDAHLHRLIVVDEGDRPVGIVTSTDILAAVASMEGDEVCRH